MNRILFFLLIFTTLNINAQNIVPEMILVEGGDYYMGNHESQFLDEYPRHQVSLGSFYISKYEITIADYSKFSSMAGLPVSSGADNMPASEMTWEQAIMYCNWLSSVSGLQRCYEVDRTGKQIRVTYNKEANGYRLPTEAEWEYAARGGVKHSSYAYSGSDDAREVAWFTDNGKQIHPVGELKPNALGIFDMSGNVKEWCWDYYSESYYKLKVKDNPAGPEHGTTRVVRGGSYNAHFEMLRVNKRYYFMPDESDNTIGIRIVRSSF